MGGSHHKVEHNRATSIYSQGVSVCVVAAAAMPGLPGYYKILSLLDNLLDTILPQSIL